ncbi:MAG: hypothetical protein RI973_410 [Bacteroidota bacterium]
MTNRQKYNQAFLQELEQLNPAQKQAVDQIEGPVMVIAGPGTGKTHILAARIGRILLETDALPHNILCLTFTDAGVQAMRQRLINLIGPEGHRVHIFTFHAFCNTVIQDNLELFGIRNLEPITDLERVEIIRRILEELPMKHPLRQEKADVWFYENHLRSLFSQMKAEGWSPEHVETKIGEYLASLPTRQEYQYLRQYGEFKAGDLKKGKLEDEKAKMERLNSAVALYPRFEQLMAEARRYDYDDMILMVLKAFRDYPNLLARYQEQYLYILVDEFQDTNGSQNQVLQRLIEYWQSPNVFIVGDDDQSIYEFQGARLKSLTDFYEQYQEDLKLVVLTDNYRSTQAVLDVSGELIKRNKLRIVNSLRSKGVEKVLNARHPSLMASPVVPEVVSYISRLAEEAALVDQLEALFKQGFPLDEVAVITARHRQLQRLTELLGKRGIPYRVRRPVNALDVPLIESFREVLEYLHTEAARPYSGEHLLFRMLHFDFFGVKPRDLARLAFHIRSLTGAEQRNSHWRDWIADAQFLEAAGLEQPGAVLALSAFVESMLSEYTNIPLPVLVERVINRSGLLQKVLKDKESGWEMEVLFAVFQFIQNEANRNPRMSLGRLLEVFKRMDANKLSLPVNGAVHASAASDTEQPLQGVNLLTAHSSKGLEFQKVFMPDCVDSDWEPARYASRYQFTLPDTLTLSVAEEDAMEARRRLFFVAMTRAKETLRLSYAGVGDDEKPLQHAQFIDELLGDGGLKLQEEAVAPSRLMAAKASLLLERKPVALVQHEELVRATLERFSLSPSALTTYLRCPLSFYYEHVLKMPGVQTEAAAYGQAMHEALRRGFEKMLRPKSKEQYPGAAAFVRFFEEEMRQRQAFFGKKEYEARLSLGRQRMESYVLRNVEHWPKKVQVEQRFRQVVVDGVPITGIIDRIDSMEQLEVHLVDYKTGSHNSARIQGPSDKQPQGGSYWRQLYFYKILHDNWRDNPRIAVSAEISYLDPDDKGNFPAQRIVFNPEEVGFVKQLIRESYEKIMRQEFYEGCGETTCPWCRFVSQQQPSDSFADLESEALDD